jgi:photosystem II stability/assembly factor-like uncharacterized protein
MLSAVLSMAVVCTSCLPTAASSRSMEEAEEEDSSTTAATPRTRATSAAPRHGAMLDTREDVPRQRSARRRPRRHAFLMVCVLTHSRFLKVGRTQ